MTTAHPAIDDIADYSEDLLPPDRAERVQRHVATCDECTETLHALADVSDVLRETPTPAMPVDVMATIDAAIAAESHERATGVVSMAARRREREPRETSPSRRTNAFRIVGVAAAALVVAAVAGGVILNQDDPATNTAGDQPAGQTMAQPSAMGDQDTVSADVSLTTPAEVRAAARELASGGLMASTATSCRLPQGLTQDALSALTTYQGTQSVIVLDKAASQVSVYACSDAQRLYSGSY